MFTTGLSTQQVSSLIQSKLAALRKALSDVEDLHAWSSGITATDMSAAAGLSTADASTAMAAIADAAALKELYDTGLPPGTYPQPSSAYPYGASQRQVIGPQ